jgi:hypothetical protein
MADLTPADFVACRNCGHEKRVHDASMAIAWGKAPCNIGPHAWCECTEFIPEDEPYIDIRSVTVYDSSGMCGPSTEELPYPLNCGVGEELPHGPRDGRHAPTETVRLRPSDIRFAACKAKQ